MSRTQVITKFWTFGMSDEEQSLLLAVLDEAIGRLLATTELNLPTDSSRQTCLRKLQILRHCRQSLAAVK